MHRRRNRRQRPHVVERGSFLVTDQLQWAPWQIWQRAVGDLRPVFRKLLFRWRHGFRQQLQDVLTRPPASFLVWASASAFLARLWRGSGAPGGFNSVGGAPSPRLSRASPQRTTAPRTPSPSY